MESGDLLTWANTTDVVTIPAIEQDVVELQSMQSATSALLSAKVQEFGDKLDAHTVSLAVNFSASEVANTRSYYALSQLYDINLRINTEVASLRNQLRNEFTATFDARDVAFGTSVKNEILDGVTSSVNSAMADIAIETSNIANIYQTVTDVRTEILAAVDGVLDTTLPMLNSLQGVVLAKTDATDNMIAYHLAGFDKPTLMEGIDQVMTDTGAMVSGLRVEYESSLAGLNSFLVQNYYTIVDADQAMSLATQALQSSLEGVGGSIYDTMAFAVATDANLTTNYLTYTQVDQAIASFDMSLNTSIGTVTAGIDVNAAAIVGINAKAFSMYAIQATAGGAIGSFEVVAWDDIGGSGSAVKINADNILLEGTVSANKIVIGDFTNHVMDPQGRKFSNWSFSADVVTSGLWVTPDGSDPIPSGIYVNSVAGLPAAFMGTTTGYGIPDLSNGIEVRPGEAYLVKAWIYKEVGATPIDARLGFLITNATSDSVDNQFIGAQWLAGDSGWIELTGTIVIPDLVGGKPSSLALVHVGIGDTATLSGVKVIFGGMSIRKSVDSVMIADGVIKTNHMQAGSIDANIIGVGKLNARFLEVTELLTIDAVNAGFSMGKVSAFDLDTDGIYLGTTDLAGSNSFGMMAGTTYQGKDQYLQITEPSGLRLLNARHLVTANNSTGGVYINTTPGSRIVIAPGPNKLTLAILGGGGGGASEVNGGAGGWSRVRLYDGNTYTGQEWISLGGAGGALWTYSPAGQSSIWGSGGAGGYMETYEFGAEGNIGTRYIGAGPASGYGSGGGGRYRHGGGKASQPTYAYEFDLSAYANPQLEIVLGSIGGNGGSSSTNGTPGRVMYSTAPLVEIPADVVPLKPTASGTFNTTAGAAFTFPNLGPGYWYISTVSGLPLNIGYPQTSPGISLLVYYNVEASFFASQTPYVPSVYVSRGINYTFHSMAKWT